MAIVVFVTKLFCRVDDPMKDIPNHLPGITVAERAGHYIGLLYAIKGIGKRPFYLWLRANYQDMFPLLPGLLYAIKRKEALLPVAPRHSFRRLQNRQAWTDRFLVSQTAIGLLDTYGFELRHPIGKGGAQDG